MVTAKQQLLYIRQQINANKLSQRYLHKISSVDTSIVNRLLNNNYSGDADKYINEIYTALINVEESKKQSAISDVFDTSVMAMCKLACQTARQQRSMAVVSGSVGIGKTFCLTHYTNNTPRTLMIEPDATYTLGVLVDDIALKAGVNITNAKGRKLGIADRMVRITDKLNDTDTVLIIDEANLMTDKQLNLVRRLHDKTGIGVVFAGTAELESMFQPHQGHFDQIRSRITFWPPIITSITFEDCEKIMKSEFNASEKLIQAIWKYSGGSMRVLCRQIIKHLHTAIRNGATISDTLVESIATNVLNIHAR